MQRVFGGLILTAALYFFGGEIEKMWEKRIGALLLALNRAETALHDYREFGLNIKFDCGEMTALTEEDKLRLEQLKAVSSDSEKFTRSAADFGAYCESIKKKNSALAANARILGVLIGLVCFAILY